MAAEPPHNINDHGSNSGDGILTTFASTMAQAGANTIYGGGPSIVVIGPEHAATLARDKWTAETIQQHLYETARVPEANVSPENRERYAETGHVPENGFYKIAPTPTPFTCWWPAAPASTRPGSRASAARRSISVRVKQLR